MEAGKDRAWAWDRSGTVSLMAEHEDSGGVLQHPRLANLMQGPSSPLQKGRPIFSISGSHDVCLQASPSNEDERERGPGRVIIELTPCHTWNW